MDFQAAFANRGLVPQRVPSVSAPLGQVPQTESGPGAESVCEAYRVQLAGGQLMALANHPALTPIIQLYRKLPVDGVFTATPANPVVIELGAFQVPNQMALLMLDYRFDVYRFSGAIVGDFVPMEDRRYSTSIGNDVLFSNKRPENLRYEAIPSLPSPSKEGYQGNSNAGTIPGGGPSTAPQNQFDQIRFQRLQGPSGQGLSMIPNRHRRDAQLAMPFTYVVGANQRVQLLTIAFQPIGIPIAFFEGEFSGLLLAQNMLKDFLDAVAPCSNNKMGAAV